jgi:hypothetical protein
MSDAGTLYHEHVHQVRGAGKAIARREHSFREVRNGMSYTLREYREYTS